MGKGLVAEAVGKGCGDAGELHEWVRMHLGVSIPRVAVCGHHQAPFEYLKAAYFEPGRDLIVWAPRGGGKTFLGAVATLLDLLHKPGCQVRILGGSLEQSLRMWEHLWPMVMRVGEDLVAGRPRVRKIELVNGAGAAVLTQSERAVRGLRVQKLRCDEVELFDPGVWEAAQLITRSKARRHEGTEARSGGEEGGSQSAKCKMQNAKYGGIAGVVEAMSTLHAPYGLMGRIVEEAERAGRPIVRWCLMEVLERCGEERECAGCALWEDCGGVAKTRCEGFVGIEDAIAMKERVSRETWEAEMMCRRPSVRQAVFPGFEEEVHVTEMQNAECGMMNGEITLSMDFGFANPFVCLWVRRWEDGRVWVVDEYVQPGRSIHEHLEQIRRRPWGGVGRVTCDPAGQGRNDQTAASDVMVLKKAGYAVRCKSSAIVEGLEMIRTALRPAAGKARLFIHPRCKRLIRAMKSYRYAEGGSELPVKDGEHDHLIDALRYHFVNAETSTKARWRRY